jgi:hypothetical protein
MRVTISHKKTRQQIVDLVEQNTNQLLQGLAAGAPVQLANMQRRWNASKMDFAFDATAGFLRVPIRGFIEVTDTEVIIDADLPAFLTEMLPEEKMRASLESKAKGLLT